MLLRDVQTEHRSWLRESRTFRNTMLFSKFLISAIVFLTFALYKVTGKDTEWWKYTTIYEVFIRSFKDSNGDGIGDIPGIILKLDHFVDLGIETLWLTPYFKSPMHDFGYDISNFTAIEPTFGTLHDFDKLVKEMKKRGMKLMMDFVINHSSDQHPWFLKSIDRIEPYTDYYVWKDAKGYDSNGNPIPPNNWKSVFPGLAWTWNNKRKQFYLHQFAEIQPDLNLRNPKVIAELKRIMEFWFRRGVHAARIDAARYFIEDEYFRDEPLLPQFANKTVPEYFDYDHIYTTDLWETYELLHELREFSEKLVYDNEDEEPERLFVVESYTDMEHTMLYYGKKNYSIVHFPFNFDFADVNSYLSAAELDEHIRTWLDNMPAGAVANWLSENHDKIRVGYRLNEEYADILLITATMLPGVLCVYYGQEIGMKDMPLRPDQILDAYGNGKRPSRDAQRLPMQWEDSINGGFSTNLKTWLPVNPDYYKVNVQLEKNQEVSRYKMFKALSELRKTKTAKFGRFNSYIISQWVYAFTRSVSGEPMYIVLINLGNELEIVYLRDIISNLPSVLKVATGSMNAGYRKGYRIFSSPRFFRSFIMKPMSAIVLSTK